MTQKIRTSKAGQTPGIWIDHPAAVAIAVLTLAVFYLVTLVDGQNWSGDFSLYILHAQNLAEGRHYLDTGYWLNSVSRFVGPHAYPPVFPLLLAPVYALFGLNLEAFKWVPILCFCVSLWLAARVFANRLNQRLVLFLVLVVGLNPYLWDFTNLIRADFTFMVFSYLSLLLMLRFLANGTAERKGARRQAAEGILIGCAMYMAYGTREIGIVLPLTLLTYDIVSRRSLSITGISALGVFALFAWLQSVWFSASFIPEYVEQNLKNLTHAQPSTELNHLSFVDLSPHRILDRIIGYRWALQNFWPTTSFTAINFLNELLFNLFSLLAVAGYIQALVRRITVVEIFLAGYIAVLLLFGAPPTIRYLIPVLPVFLYYGFLFCQETVFPRLPRLKYGVAAAYALILAMISLPVMVNMAHLQLAHGITHPDARALFRFVKTETAPHDVIVFIKPRIMALMTGRNSATWPSERYNTPQATNLYFDAMKADYYVDMKLENWMLPLTQSEPPSDCFNPVFSNQHFVVYRYEKPLCQRADSAADPLQQSGRS